MIKYIFCMATKNPYSKYRIRVAF